MMQLISSLEAKMAEVVKRNKGRIPYISINGRFNDYSDDNHICWWTNGFWGGILWQMYHLTGSSLYRSEAELLEARMDVNFLRPAGLDHDNGFKWLPTSVTNYKLTKNARSGERAMLAASLLAGRYNPAGSFIRAWNGNGDLSWNGIAIIDCMMNLPLLYWATQESKDPRFGQMARNHANTAMRHFVRADGSIHHIVEFDPENGAVVGKYGGQGYKDGSSWTRGQAWGIYGFALSYKYTNDINYLQTACRAAQYFIRHIPASFIIPLDFQQPEDCLLEDSSAASAAASGLLELAKFVTGKEAEVYTDIALQLLKTLADTRCSWQPQTDHLLENCTVAYRSTEQMLPIIYGDYYFIEAILKAAGKNIEIW